MEVGMAFAWKGAREDELFGVIEIIYFSIVVVFTWVYVFFPKS